MSKVLALGTGPLLEGGVRAFGAHCLRTWSLVKPLLDAGQEVALFTLPILTDQPELQQQSGLAGKECQGFRYQAFRNNDDAYNLQRLNEACASMRPDCLLGINSYPSALMARVGWSAPLWADFYGWVMAEGQVKSALYGHNFLLGRYWALEEAPLRRADKFSTVSMRQFYALHGELAAVGRLNRHTAPYSFAHCLPASCDPFYADPANQALGTMRLRGAMAPRDAFILLWSGGYNAWTRFDLLFEAVSRAMEACPSLHYVSTGGPYYGHDDLSYARFEALVAASPLRPRFHLLGWIEAAELPALYAQADLGLCADSKNTESLFGTRTRVINMMAAGLPVLLTVGTEIAEALVGAGCALGRRQDDPQDLAQGIVEACGDPESLKELGAKGRRHVLERFSFERAAAPLIEWVRRPAFAPDNQFKLQRAPAGTNPFGIPTNPIEEALLAGSALPPIPKQGLVEKAKRASERWIGPERYAKLRFVRQHWLRRYWPRYRRRRAEIRAGRLGVVEDLTVYLTGACNLPCPQCAWSGGASGGGAELRLDDWRAIAPSLPRLECLTLGGGEALLSPHCKEIAQILARQTRAGRLRILSNGFLPARLEALCASLLEEGLPGVLEACVFVDGLESTHNSLRRNDRAWILSLQALHGLAAVQEQSRGRFELAATTVIHEKNYRELEALNDFLRARLRLRHRFELAPTAEGSVWGLPAEIRGGPACGGLSLPPADSWDAILRTLKKINRRAGLPNHADHLALAFAVRMMRGGKGIVPCAAAGQNIAFIHGDGGVALCECSKPFGNLRDYGMDFGKAWGCAEAQERRTQLRQCHCALPSCLAKNIEYSLAGQIAMLRDL